MSSKVGYVLGVGALVTSALVLATGCAHQAAIPPPATPLAGAPVSLTTTTSGQQAQPVRNDLAISAALIEACKIELDNVQQAPKFDFDAAEIRDTDRAVLEKLAECVTVGPLKGHALHLVGRADPRGEEEYNMVLGSSRASSVGRYLQSLGVSSGHITSSSRGKLDATGTDDASWQLDRRVDID